MSENLEIVAGSKLEKYTSLLPQIENLCLGERNKFANLANVCAALRQTFRFFWVGFYEVDPSSEKPELVLSAFQGDIACTRIAKGKGVCGTAWQTENTQLVPDVEQFSGHIACSASTKSEIVVPIFKNKHIVAVLDIDSDVLNDFDEQDVLALEKLCRWLGETIF
jgi:L-methionine (R)-S-oxide reductase